MLTLGTCEGFLGVSSQQDLRDSGCHQTGGSRQKKTGAGRNKEEQAGAARKRQEQPGCQQPPRTDGSRAGSSPACHTSGTAELGFCSSARINRRINQGIVKLVPGLQEQPGWQEGSPSLLLPCTSPGIVWVSAVLCGTELGWAGCHPHLENGVEKDLMNVQAPGFVPCHAMASLRVSLCAQSYRAQPATGDLQGRAAAQTQQAVLAYSSSGLLLLGEKCLGQASGGCRAMVKELLAPDRPCQAAAACRSILGLLSLHLWLENTQEFPPH